MEPGESAAPEEDLHWPSDTEESSFASTIEEGQDMEVQFARYEMIIGASIKGN